MTQKPKTVDPAVFQCVVQELHRCMRHLHFVEKVSIEDILAVMNSEILTQISGFFGGKVAAQCVENAIRQIESLPASPEFQAAMATPAGRVQ